MADNRHGCLSRAQFLGLDRSSSKSWYGQLNHLSECQPVKARDHQHERPRIHFDAIVVHTAGRTEGEGKDEQDLDVQVEHRNRGDRPIREGLVQQLPHELKRQRFFLIVGVLDILQR
jgi:hypothetical protein